jgi:hypothetical protein
VADDIAADVAMAAQLAKNKPYILPGATNFATTLAPDQEAAFGQWVQQNHVPFDPAQRVQDYDMRGFYQALMAKDPRAMTAVNPNDQQLHYPDYWKTPYHQSFSAESQWANPQTAPKWNEQDQLVLPNGTVVFDEKARSKR